MWWKKRQEKKVNELLEKSQFARISLGGNDVLVLMVNGPVYREMEALVRQHFKNVFPDNDVLVLGDGMTLGVINRQEVSSARPPESLTQYVQDYVEGYEMRDGSNAYQPNGHERMLILDAILGLLVDEDFAKLALRKG